jgi:N-acetylglucosaminyldiphosphoundecaprenol N-acetyl-beta-D-mannosaminyltransferase
VTDTIEVWGLPLKAWTLPRTVSEVARLIEAGKPSLFITANLHYAMLTAKDPRLAGVNRRAAFIVADGMPLVWASRRHGPGLPERVTGSDLIYALSEQAARLGHRLFLLGGQPGVGETAARNLTARYPGLQVVGVESPPFRPLNTEEHQALVSRIRKARPDLLLVAFGQPRGELWLDQYAAELGVPVAAQVGASIDFAAGRVSRAPIWLQRCGLEWTYRLALEPRRLAGRYAQNAAFLLRMAGRDLLSLSPTQSH